MCAIVSRYWGSEVLQHWRGWVCPPCLSSTAPAAGCGTPGWRDLRRTGSPWTAGRPRPSVWSESETQRCCPSNAPETHIYSSVFQRGADWTHFGDCSLYCVRRPSLSTRTCWPIINQDTNIICVSVAWDFIPAWAISESAVYVIQRNQQLTQSIFKTDLKWNIDDALINGWIIKSWPFLLPARQSEP